MIQLVMQHLICHSIYVYFAVSCLESVTESHGKLRA